MQSRNHDLEILLKLASRGSVHSLRNLLEAIRSPLLKYVGGHFDRRVSARVDVDDVVQDILLYVTNHLAELAQPCPVPFKARLRSSSSRYDPNLAPRKVRTGRRGGSNPPAFGAASRTGQDIDPTEILRRPKYRIDRTRTGNQ